MKTHTASLVGLLGVLARYAAGLTLESSPDPAVPGSLLVLRVAKSMKVYSWRATVQEGDDKSWAEAAADLYSQCRGTLNL